METCNKCIFFVMLLDVFVATPISLCKDLLHYAEDDNSSFLREMINYDQTIQAASHVRVGVVWVWERENVVSDWAICMDVVISLCILIQVDVVISLCILIQVDVVISLCILILVDVVISHCILIPY